MLAFLDNLSRTTTIWICIGTSIIGILLWIADILLHRRYSFFFSLKPYGAMFVFAGIMGLMVALDPNTHRPKTVDNNIVFPQGLLKKTMYVELPKEIPGFNEIYSTPEGQRMKYTKNGKSQDVPIKVEILPVDDGGLGSPTTSYFVRVTILPTKPTPYEIDWAAEQAKLKEDENLLKETDETLRSLKTTGKLAQGVAEAAKKVQVPGASTKPKP